MERKKLLYWSVQLIGWTTYFLFSILLLYNTEDLMLTFNLFVFGTLSILSSILISHVLRFIIIRRSLISKQIYQLIAVTLLLAVGAAVVLETIQYFIEHLITVDYIVPFQQGQVSKPYSTLILESKTPGNMGQFITDSLAVVPEQITSESGGTAWRKFNLPNFLFAISRSIILFLVWCGFYFVFAIVEKSRAQEILNLKWEASKNEIELKNLRAQLNPHFLFNSLNSIRALVGLNPDQAKTSITQLSNLLRRSINLGKMRVIPLKEELDLVKIYLDLEQVRFEERLQTKFDIQKESLSCEIPPLMIQTVVENGIKHGISKSIDGGKLFIQSAFSKDELIITVKNSGIYAYNEETSGIGISNTRKRLSILFGVDANFDIKQEGDLVVVTIKIRYK